MDRTRQAIYCMCLYSRPRSKTALCRLSPGNGVFLFDTDQLNFVTLIFYLVSSLHSCGAKHVFGLQSSVWCWRSLGSELRLLTDGQVPLWPWYPDFLHYKHSLLQHHRRGGKPQPDRLKDGGELLWFCCKSVLAQILIKHKNIFAKVSSLQQYVTVCREVTLFSASYISHMIHHHLDHPNKVLPYV